MKKIEFLAIGDIVVDAFIKLKDAEELINHGTLELCVRFGDKVPYESVTVIPAVGNSPNAAVSAARLGLRSAVMTNIGDDKNGQDCLKVLKNEKINTEFVKKEKGKITNYHYVLWYDVDRTILIKHESYSRELSKTKATRKNNIPAWIYLSSLGENSLPFHGEIAEYLKQNLEIKLAFQPGTFQIKFGAEKLAKIYKHAEIFFCNVQEAQEILQTDSADLPTLLAKMSALGPKIVVITDGIRGAYAFDTIKNEKWFVPCYPGEPAYERTGAGDAFSSTVVAALALGESLETALLWAPVNAMSVTLFVGAQKGLLSQEKIKEFLANAPEGYRLQKI